MRPRKAKRPIRRRAAAVNEILGIAPRPIPSRWRKQFTRLTGLRDALINRQSELTNDALEEQPNFSSHMADAGTDEYDRDFALSMLSSEQDALYQIEQALDRIRNGTYGTCELTGKRIEPERLEAIPWTRFSKEAEVTLEKQGILRRTRLGPRETVAKAAPTESVDDME